MGKAVETVEDLIARLPEDVTLGQLSHLIGVNERNVMVLAQRGVVVRTAPGRYALMPSLSGYIKSLREAAAGRAGGEGGKSLAQERAELTAVEKKLAEHRLNQALGRVITVDEAVAGWSRIALKTKSTLLGLASRIGFAVPHLTAHDRVEIARICREALHEIAAELEGDPVAGSSSTGKELLADDL